MILFVLPYQKLHAQSIEKDAIERLKTEGFEEIRIRKEGTQIICTVERGLTRNPAQDFRRAFMQLNKLYPDTFKFQIILLEQGQPVYQLSAEAFKENDGQDTIALAHDPWNGKVTYYDKETYQRIKKEPVHRSVRRGVTLTLYPQVAYRNITVDQLYEKQFNLAPTLQYSGWKGMLLTGQIIFPLYNQWGYLDDYIRPGFLTISQNFTLPGLNSLRLTGGNFNKDSYGLDFRWKKRFQNSRWNVSANVGLTGRSNFYDQYWNHSSMNRLSWNVKAGYYLPFYQMQADLQVGQFLANDRGFRGDLYRHFGEVTIGVYAGHAERSFGGFHFAFPLDPFKRKHKHRVRVLLPSTYDNEYNASSEYVYGRYYEISPDENRSVKDLYPQFINELYINH